jgi:hypothetical protein
MRRLLVGAWVEPAGGFSARGMVLVHRVPLRGRYTATVAQLTHRMAPGE